MIDNTDKSFYPVNFLTTIATLFVFILHTSIFSARIGFQWSWWNAFLRTPAWGAVWIFIVLSGYKIGNGFFSGKYKENDRYTIKSICLFYKNRFLKIVLPCWCFILIFGFFLDSDFFKENPSIIYKILFFNYKNIPASDNFGATWYISTLFWLYIFAPFICFFFEKLDKKVKRNRFWILLNFFIAFIWCAFRVLSFFLKFEWSSRVYVPFYMNFDLFTIGILINKITPFFSKRNKKVSVLVLVLLVLITEIFDFLGGKYIIIYQYIFPTLYAFMTEYFLLSFNKRKYEYYSIFNILINKFTSISYCFYLFHSTILNYLSKIIELQNPFFNHCFLLFCGGGLTLLISWIWTNAFQGITNKKGEKKNEPKI